MVREIPLLRGEIDKGLGPQPSSFYKPEPEEDNDLLTSPCRRRSIETLIHLVVLCELNQMDNDIQSLHLPRPEYDGRRCLTTRFSLIRTIITSTSGSQDG